MKRKNLQLSGVASKMLDSSKAEFLLRWIKRQHEKSNPKL